MDEKPKQWRRGYTLAAISCWLAWIVAVFRSEEFVVAQIGAIAASFFIGLVIGGAVLT
jgi:hypothetical protein